MRRGRDQAECVGSTAAPDARQPAPAGSPRPPGRIGPAAAYLLIALAPLSVMFAVGPPLLAGLAAGYGQPVVELSELAALVFCLVALAGRGGRPAPARFTRLLVALAALALLTAPFALSPPFAAHTALRWTLVAAVGWALVRVPLAPATLALVLCLALLPHLAAAVGQTVLQRPLGWPGEATLPLSAAHAPVIGGGTGRWLRPFGLTFHPNVLGGYCYAALLLVLPALSRPALWAMWTALWTGLALSFSRSAWLATAATLPFAAWAPGRAMWPRAAPRAVLGLVVLLLLAGAVLLRDQLRTRLAPLTGATTAGAAAERQSLTDRVEMAAIASQMIRADPLLGVGAGNFPLAMARFETTVPPQSVHNVPLLLAAEVGVLGGLLWGAAWIAGWIALLRHWRSSSPALVAALATWCGLGLIALFDCYPWSLQSGRLLTALTLALIDVSWPPAAGSGSVSPPDGRASPPPRAR